MEMTNSMIQESAGLEREVTNYWLAHYFQAQKELNRTYSALVLIWMRTVRLRLVQHPCRFLSRTALVQYPFYHTCQHMSTKQAASPWLSRMLCVPAMSVAKLTHILGVKIHVHRSQHYVGYWEDVIAITITDQAIWIPACTVDFFYNRMSEL